MRIAPLLLLAATVGDVLSAQEPRGLAASALADTSFHWIARRAPGYRVYFLTDSYPARHQDSLLARLPPALDRAGRLIDAPTSAALIDLFFIENRAQMRQLTGVQATGYAEPAAHAVFLVTNPSWRAFERHEVMHVVAAQAWGTPGPANDWLVEGLAQAADGRCGSYSNADVARSLAAEHDWLPLDTLLTAFRRQPDLRAYLQAAAFVEYLLEQVGPAPLRAMWREGARPDRPVGEVTLAAHEARWRRTLRPSRELTPAARQRIETHGCG